MALNQICCYRSFIIILLFIFYIQELDAVKKDKSLSRQKRFYFPYGGGFKIVIGFAIPVKLGLRQSMAVGWNFQFQYFAAQFTNQTQVWPPIVTRSRQKREQFVSERAAFYKGIEDVLDRNGINGKACLLRSICENASDTTLHDANGIYGHLVHIVLTPDYGDGDLETDLDLEYVDAKKAGAYGVDCLDVYKECEYGSGLLDMVSLLDY